MRDEGNRGWSGIAATTSVHSVAGINTGKFREEVAGQEQWGVALRKGGSGTEL